MRDTVRECLEKDPSDRTDDDIEILLEFTQHLRAFANMTLSVRRALCRVMVFAVVEKAGTVVMNDGEELDSWSVIINGHVEIDGGASGEPGRALHLGDRLVNLSIQLGGQEEEKKLISLNLNLKFEILSFSCF